MEHVDETFGCITLTVIGDSGTSWIGAANVSQLKQEGYRFFNGRWQRIQIEAAARLGDILESGVLSMKIQRSEIVLSNGLVSLYDLRAILKKAGCSWHGPTKTWRISATPAMRTAIAKARERAQAREATGQEIKRGKLEEGAVAIERTMEAVEHGVNRHAASLLPIGNSIHSDVYKKRILKGQTELIFLGISPKELFDIRMKKLMVG